MSMKVSGVGSTIRSKLTDDKAVKDADKIAGDSMHSLGTRASERAPVDTGLLSSTMISGIHKDYGSGELFPKWELLQRTEYTLTQEFGHASKDRFIRDSAIEERLLFVKSISDRFKKKRGGGR